MPIIIGGGSSGAADGGYRGNFAPLTAYVMGDTVTMPDGTLRSPVTPFTSGVAFNAADWMLAAADERFGPILRPAPYGPSVVTSARLPLNTLNDFDHTNGRTGRQTFKAGVDCTDLRFHFYGWYGAVTEDPLPVAIQVKAAIEVSGTIYPLTFSGGVRLGSVEPYGELVTDAFAIPLKKGDRFSARAWFFSANAAARLAEASYGDNGLSTGDGTVTGDFCDAGGTFAGPTTAAMPLLGKVSGTVQGGPVVSVVVRGDSIANGVTKPGGWVSRALINTPSIKNTHGGDRLANHSANRCAGSARRTAAAAGHTHEVIAEGYNDIVSGAGSVATYQANLLALGTAIAGRGTRPLACTITPGTYTIDDWTTASGQYTQQDTQRQQCNAWLRAGLPIDPTTKAAVAVGTTGALLAGQAGHPFAIYKPGQYVVDPASIVEVDASNVLTLTGGRWLAGGHSVNDAAITTATNVLDSATANFQVSDVTKSVYVEGAGAQRTVTDAAITTGTPNLSSVSAAWAANDAGAVVSIPGAGPAGGTLVAKVINPGGTIAVLDTNASTTVSAATVTITKALVTTIASRNSATQVVLAATASQTVSGARLAVGTPFQFVLDGTHPSEAGYDLIAPCLDPTAMRV